MFNLIIQLTKKENDDPILQKADGYCDSTAKIIVVKKAIRDEFTVKDLDYAQKKVLRHEVIHAFLYESGLTCDTNSADHWAENEEMVDWIAHQAPKIHKVYKKLKAL